jgi:MarR family 2-MHQ and catechol resistance regulon transcriptional repressor
MAASVIPMITLWEEFLGKHADGDINQFARWIMQKDDAAEAGTGLLKPGVKPGIKKTDGYATEDLNETSRVLLYLSKLHRYMQRKSKPVIKKLGFAKDHEYAMLTYIHLLKNPNKKELAKRLLLENSTAVEISNRLVKKGYIEETVDTGDKRSTRVSLTPAGEQKLLESYPYMEKAYTGFLGCLGTGEQAQLADLLQKVEEYHAGGMERGN